MHRQALADAAAAEGKDALDERLRTHAGADCSVDVATERRPLARVLLRHLAVTQDCREHVVEVVCNSAGQRADRLELLCLTQLAFESITLDLGILAVGDVFHRTRHAIRLAFFIAQRDAALAVPMPLTVTLVPQPVLDLPRLARPAQVRRQSILDTLFVVGVVGE